MKKHTFTRAQKREIERYISKEGKRKIKDTKALDRLNVLHMRSLGMKNKEIVKIVDYSEQYVTELVAKYINEGMDGILVDKRTGNNRNMSFAEEVAFLDGFIDMADAGQIVTIHIIMEKYIEITGKPCPDTTIYRLLKRHGWRKVAPRPAHPGKATEEEINSSKKLTNDIGIWCRNVSEVCTTKTSITKT